MVKKSVPTTPDTKVAKVVNLSISVGDEDSARLLPEFIAALRSAIGDEAKSVTVTGSHYLILKNGGGKVCREPDYDPETRDFRPGATPPAWAGGTPEAQRVERQQSAPAGARDPEHLRTVEETLRAKSSGGVAKKLSVKRGTTTGGLSAPRSAPRPAPVPEVTVDVKSAEGSAERTAEDASSDLLSKLRRGMVKGK